MNITKYKKRAIRVRAKIRQVSVLPRLSVFRSNAHIWAQIIDDSKKVTLTAVSEIGLKGTKTEKAVAVGTLIAEKSLGLGIKKVVFDRGSYRFHGRVKALAEAARKKGLDF